MILVDQAQALEPSISAQIMELHHGGHHRAYVSNLNAAVQKVSALVEAKDVAEQIALQETIKFNGGGHINHSLFWKNLAPSSSQDADPASAPRLSERIVETWGSVDNFRAAFNAELLGIKGSGWGWLVVQSGAQKPWLRIVTTKDQDVPGTQDETPIIGIDMWEHAYYLQVRRRARDKLQRPLSNAALIPVPEREGCLRQEHLECGQLEDG